MSAASPSPPAPSDVVKAFLPVLDALDALVGSLPERFRRPTKRVKSEVTIGGTTIPIVTEIIQPYKRSQKLSQVLPLSPKKAKAFLEACSLVRQMGLDALRKVGVERVDEGDNTEFNAIYCTGEPPYCTGYVSPSMNKVIRPRGVKVL